MRPQRNRRARQAGRARIAGFDGFVRDAAIVQLSFRFAT